MTALTLSFFIVGLFCPHESETFEDPCRQRLAVIPVGKMQIDAPFLHDRNLECLDELDKRSVRILDVGEMSVSFTHLEVTSAVAYELMSHSC